MKARAAVLALAVLAAGCSLPLPRGVQVPGKVAAGQRQPRDIQVLPPGPRTDAKPIAVVTGFLGAQSNPDRQHAIARQFLTPARRTSWRDAGEVRVYDPRTLQVKEKAQLGDQSTVEVSADVTGVIHPDGSYEAMAPAQLIEAYGLRRVDRGPWQLSDVPAGLRLSPADRDRSFRVRRTYFLAPSYAGGRPDHLVADQVLLPIQTDPAPSLVARLLSGPSRLLEGSVLSDVPAGTSARSVTTTAQGMVTVDLSAQVQQLPGAARQGLSAQLVWTLRQLGPAFSGLRLLVDGRPFRVPDTGAEQPSGEWEAYDPDGLGSEPPLSYLADHRLRAVGTSLPPGPATSGSSIDAGSLPVDAVAVTPDGLGVALLTGGPPSTVQVRTGPLRALSYAAPRVRLRGLTSPSWGSGEAGLWLLRGQDVLLLPAAGPARSVPLGRGVPAPLTSLAVSRDGARLALVAGGRLFVGRVEHGGAGGIRVAGLMAIAPQLAGVTSVAWETGTSLVVLGRVRDALLPVRVAVDGSSFDPLDGPGLPGPPPAVAASPAGVWVTAGAGRAGRLYRLRGRGFDAGPFGSDPVYPG